MQIQDAYFAYDTIVINQWLYIFLLQVKCTYSKQTTALNIFTSIINSQVPFGVVMVIKLGVTKNQDVSMTQTHAVEIMMSVQTIYQPMAKSTAQKIRDYLQGEVDA